ncbi:MAG: hypothetical protein MJ154_01620 [Candidatus Saccharibacteria bacterium]|nr:hypothetical protein [Candidatus Saccharibacteria bacterium]
MRRIDYVSAYRKALEENVSEVKKAVLTRDSAMLLKIHNYSERFNLPEKFVEHKILKDNVFANQFAKDPSKQSLHQKIAADFISSITEVVNFAQLPASGGDACYICDDGVVRKGVCSHGLTKSIDFYWEYGDCRYFAAHKHTTYEGGAQDNQFNDLQAFLENASKSTLANTFFIAIGDGEYYQKKYTESGVSYETRIDYMNSNYGSEFALAATCNDLEEFMVAHSGNRMIE